MSKTILHMKIEEELKEQLRQIADLENRSLSNLVEKVLIDLSSKKRALMRPIYPSPHSKYEVFSRVSDKLYFRYKKSPAYAGQVVPGVITTSQSTV